MAKIESKIGKIGYNDERIFGFLSDFNNFNPLLQGKVENWESTSDTCRFSVKGMADMSMKIVEKEPNKLIKITDDGSAPLKFTLWIQLKQVAPYDTRVKITVRPEVNVMMRMMVKKPFKQFADNLVDTLEKFPFP